jgi:hypothetical protein
MSEHTVRLTPAPVPDPITVETGDSVIFDNTAGTAVENVSSNDGVTFTTGRIHPGSTSMPIRFDSACPGVAYTTTSGRTGTVIVNRGAVRFFDTIKPYFTPFDRSSMMDPAHTFGVITFDLWSPADCQTHWDAILGAISDGSMPPDEPGSEGPWPPAKIAQFVDDFTRWKDGGFQR